MVGTPDRVPPSLRRADSPVGYDKLPPTRYADVWPPSPALVTATRRGHSLVNDSVLHASRPSSWSTATRRPSGSSRPTQAAGPAGLPHPGRARGFHRRDTLLALFWPELTGTRPPSAPTGPAPPPTCVRRGGDRDPSGRPGSPPAEGGVWCDARAFEQCVADGRAQTRRWRLYRNEFLHGVHVPEASARAGGMGRANSCRPAPARGSGRVRRSSIEPRQAGDLDRAVEAARLAQGLRARRRGGRQTLHAAARAARAIGPRHCTSTTSSRGGWRRNTRRSRRPKRQRSRASCGLWSRLQPGPPPTASPPDPPPAAVAPSAAAVPRRPRATCRRMAKAADRCRCGGRRRHDRGPRVVARRASVARRDRPAREAGPGDHRRLSEPHPGLPARGHRDHGTADRAGAVTPGASDESIGRPGARRRLREDPDPGGRSPRRWRTRWRSARASRSSCEGDVSAIGGRVGDLGAARRARRRRGPGDGSGDRGRFQSAGRCDRPRRAVPPRAHRRIHPGPPGGAAALTGHDILARGVTAVLRRPVRPWTSRAIDPRPASSIEEAVAIDSTLAMAWRSTQHPVHQPRPASAMVDAPPAPTATATDCPTVSGIS